MTKPIEFLSSPSNHPHAFYKRHTCSGSGAEGEGTFSAVPIPIWWRRCHARKSQTGTQHCHEWHTIRNYLGSAQTRLRLEAEAEGIHAREVVSSIISGERCCCLQRLRNLLKKTATFPFGITPKRQRKSTLPPDSLIGGTNNPRPLATLQKYHVVLV